MAKLEMIEAKHPDKTKQATRMRKDRYDIVREALLAVIPPKDADGILLSGLSDAVRDHLRKTNGKAELPDGGKIGWNVMAVKLDLEARGLIERLEVKGPQQLRQK